MGVKLQTRRRTCRSEEVLASLPQQGGGVEHLKDFLTRRLCPSQNAVVGDTAGVCPREDRPAFVTSQEVCPHRGQLLIPDPGGVAALAGGGGASCRSPAFVIPLALACDANEHVGLR